MYVSCPSLYERIPFGGPTDIRMMSRCLNVTGSAGEEQQGATPRAPALSTAVACNKSEPATGDVFAAHALVACYMTAQEHVQIR